MLNVALVCEEPMKTPFVMDSKFCEYEECFQPVGCFPYTTRDGKIFCGPTCAYLAEEDANVAATHLEEVVA